MLARTLDLLVRVEGNVLRTRSAGLVVLGLVEELHVGNRVGYILYARRHREGVVDGDVHGQLLRVAALLGGDNDHTVGTARTVERRCRRILQHRERLDRLGRYVAQHLGRDLHAVQHDQGSRVRTEGRDTADVERSAVVARLARTLRGNHTRNVTGKRSGKVTRRNDQIARLDGLHGTHQRLLLLRTESDHHDLVDLRTLLDHRHQSEQIGVVDGDLLHIVAQHVEDHGLGTLGQLELILTVRVGGNAHLGRLLDVDSHTCKRLVVGRSDDDTLQYTVLLLIGIDDGLRTAAALRCPILHTGGKRRLRAQPQQKSHTYGNGPEAALGMT